MIYSLSTAKASENLVPNLLK